MEDLNGIRTRAKVRHGERAVLHAVRSLLQTRINFGPFRRQERETAHPWVLV